MLTNFSEEVKNIKQKIIHIGQGVADANALVLEALHNCESDLFLNAKDKMRNISNKTNTIDNDIIKVLALYSPEAKDLRQVVSYFKITNELLRASTNTRNFIKGFTDFCQDMDMKLINEYVIPMQTATTRAISLSIAMVDIDCIDELQETYNEILIEENKTADMYEMLEKNLIQQATHFDDFEKFHTILKALRKSEKITDRATSIANLLLYIKIGGNLNQN